MATQSAQAAAAFAIGAAIACSDLPLWAIMLFAAANGAFVAFDIPARQAFAIEMVGKRDLLNGIALNSAVFNLGRLLGPMVAGWAIVQLGIAACFILNGLSFLGVIGVLFRMKTAETPVPQTTIRRDALLAGFRTVASDKLLLGLALCLAVVLLTGATYLTLLPAFAQYVLKSGAGGYSALLTASGLGSLIGALGVAMLDSIRARRPAIVFGILTMGCGLVALGTVGSFPAACIALAFSGAGFLFFLAAANSTLQLSVPDEVRGRVMSVWVLIFGVCQPAGNAAAGFIAASVGTSKTFILRVWVVLPQPRWH